MEGIGNLMFEDPMMEGEQAIGGMTVWDEVRTFFKSRRIKDGRR